MTTNQLINEFARVLGPTVHKGIYYFHSHKLAREHAVAHGLPTDRILPYGRGWAIQLRISGPYAGPE